MILKLLVIDNCPNCKGQGCADCMRGVVLDCIDLGTVENIADKVREVTNSVVLTHKILNIFGIPK